MNPTDSQGEDFIKALPQRFPYKAKLAIMMSVELDISLKTIVLGGDLKEVIFKVIKTVEAQGWIAKLLVAAYESKLGSPVLFICFLSTLWINSFSLKTLNRHALAKAIEK